MMVWAIIITVYLVMCLHGVVQAFIYEQELKREREANDYRRVNNPWL